MIPKALNEFEELLKETQPATAQHVVTGTVRGVFNLLGALDDSELISTVRNCNRQNPINIFVKHQEPKEAP